MAVDIHRSFAPLAPYTAAARVGRKAVRDVLETGSLLKYCTLNKSRTLDEVSNPIGQFDPSTLK